ncbi:MAG: phosphoribosylanthranilate isomerase [Candidatus Wallbacteria bacterium]|nr:phosphoribosylanthranilate isomerase [Candidatus Wallbacteria bacterium]
MTRVKICGLTNLDDALFAAECGADALGFVFAESKRRMTSEAVAGIVRHLPPLIMTVGVFADMQLEEVRGIVDKSGVCFVQLHGGESPEFCDSLAGLGLRVIKRVRVTPGMSGDEISREMQRFAVAGYLLDPGSGSGETFDWSVISGINAPVIVAGGLSPDNVGELVHRYHPYGVDACSGLEREPGRKDHEKVRLFVERVRRA